MGSDCSPTALKPIIATLLDLGGMVCSVKERRRGLGETG